MCDVYSQYAVWRTHHLLAPCVSSQVNNNIGAQYPNSIFTDASLITTLSLKDSLTYTIGFDSTTSNCAESLPQYMYLALRCGNPTQNSGSWAVLDTPCSFRVRYVLVPQHLSGGDILGPLPVAQSGFHTYSVR